MASASGGFSGRSQYSLVLTVNQNSQNVGGNYSTLGIDLRINESPNNGSYSLSNQLGWSWNVDGQTASGATTYDFRNYDVLVLSSTSINVGHAADGTKSVGFSASTSGTTVIGNASCSGSMGLTTIPRATQPTINEGTNLSAGQTVTINLPRASSSFTHEIFMDLTSVGDYPYASLGSGYGTSATYTIPLATMNRFPNSASTGARFYVNTYNGGTLIGSKWVDFTLNAAASAVPDFTTITSSEATAGVAANVGAFVQKISTLALAITGAAGVYGSTISSYKIEVLNASSVVQATINSVSGTSTPIDASGTVTLRGTITDSRGRTKTKTTTVTFLAWAPPVLTSVTARRALSGGTVDEDDGTFIRVDINAAVSSLMNTTQRNAINYRISTRTRGTTTWTEKTNTAPGGITYNNFVTITGPYAVTTAYEVLVEVYDDFATSAITLQVPVAAIFMHWDAALGVGLGKFRENGMFDVAGDIYGNAIMVSGKVVTDWNTATLGGFYQGLAGAANAPFSTQPFSGVVTVQGSTIVQRLSLTGVTNQWVRSYNGTAWSAWRRTDGFLIATSAVNATLDPITGRYNLTAGTGSWAFNGVFLAGIRQYKIFYNWYSDSINGPRFRFRKNGVDTVGSGSILYQWSNNDPVNGWSSTGGDSWFVPNRVAANGHSGEILVSEPMSTTGNQNQKKYQSIDNSWGPQATSLAAGGLGGDDLSAYDGFSLFAANAGGSYVSVGSGGLPSIAIQAVT